MSIRLQLKLKRNFWWQTLISRLKTVQLSSRAALTEPCTSILYPRRSKISRFTQPCSISPSLVRKVQPFFKTCKLSCKRILWLQRQLPKWFNSKRAHLENIRKHLEQESTLIKRFCRVSLLHDWSTILPSTSSQRIDNLAKAAERILPKI